MPIDPNDRRKWKPGPLDHNRTFRAPARRQHIWQRLCLQFPSAKPWQHEDMLRLYFPDKSFMHVDETGRVQSNGGLATKAFISFPIRDLEKNWKKYALVPRFQPESRTETEPPVEHCIPNAKQCQTTDYVQGSCETDALIPAK